MFDFGNIVVEVFEDYDGMSKRGAEILAGQINQKPDSVLGFATGTTPIGMYQHLIQMYTRNEVDFSNITSFNLDEYYPIQRDNCQSYYYFMKNQLFDHVNMNPNRIHVPNGQVEDPQAECIAYEEAIKKAGGVQLQILGIGLNGHIGFNEPDLTFGKNTRVVQLEESTIEANARLFDSKEEVPRKAISMGIKTIMMADQLLMLVNGEKKAQIIKEVLFGEITPKVPASILQLHKNVIILLDKPAAVEMIKEMNN